jgi:glycosyltransferase involved in cell wall biosynthesis
MQLNTNFLITVFIPAYNASHHINEAIDSILNQTYKDFQLLIINDGSTDNTESIIKTYSDTRIKYIKKDINTGLIDTLNLGFQITDTKYLVRMDADDISHPQRLERLTAFMEGHPGIDICGSAFEHINAKGIIPKTLKVRPEWHDDISISLLSFCALTHGTAIFRIEEWKKANMSYPQEYLHAEDYKMLVNAASKLRLHNMQESLYYFRLHDQQVSSKHYSIQAKQLTKYE